MARHTSLFSKVRGPLGELIFSTDPAGSGSIARERQQMFSIPQEDFTAEQWKLFISSKMVGLFRASIGAFIAQDRMVGLLPAWQSIMSELMNTAFMGPKVNANLAWQWPEGQFIFPNKSLHFPQSGSDLIIFAPARYRLTWSTELGVNGSANDQMYFFLPQAFYDVIDDEGNVGFTTVWAINGVANRSDGTVDIEIEGQPPGNSNILFSLMFLTSSAPKTSPDSASPVVAWSGSGQWNIVNP